MRHPLSLYALILFSLVRCGTEQITGTGQPAMDGGATSSPGSTDSSASTDDAASDDDDGDVTPQEREDHKNDPEYRNGHSGGCSRHNGKHYNKNPRSAHDRPKRH